MFNNIQPRTQGLITATRHAPHAHCERHWFGDGFGWLRGSQNLGADKTLQGNGPTGFICPTPINPTMYP